MSMMELSFSFRDFCSTKQQIEVEKTELLKGMYWQALPGPMSVYLQLGGTEISFIVGLYVDHMLCDCQLVLYVTYESRYDHHEHNIFGFIVHRLIRFVNHSDTAFETENARIWW